MPVRKAEEMKVRLLARSADDARLVRVDATGIAGWCVWPDAPAVGAVVDVELSVPGEVSWDAIEVGRGRELDPPPATGLLVRAVVLDVDEDDVATLELSSGGILLVDTVGKPPPEVVGRDVTLHLGRVLVHPTTV